MKTFLLFLTEFIFASTICSSQNFTDSNLPIVVFSTGGKPIDSAYSPVYIIWMGIIDNGAGNRNHLGDPYTYTGLIKIKTHGNSTQWFPKKSWNITTVTGSYPFDNLDTTILELPKEHDWIFKAQYEDKTFLRDELTFKIFREMGHYASRSTYFELVVDGNYRGIYQAQEKIKRDKNRVNISKLKPEETTGDALTGGYMISIDRDKNNSPGWFSKYPSNASGDSANFFLYEYPKYDSMPQVQRDYIHNFFDAYENTFNTSYWNNLDSGYIKYINLQSFIDNFLVQEFSRNTDGYRLKAWFYKDRDSKSDGKIHAVPVWDFEIGYGNCQYSGGDNPYWWQYQLNYHENFIPFWWKKILTDDYFKNNLRCRYEFLRSQTLNKDYLYAHIDSLVNYLSEAITRNYQRWPTLGKYVWPEPQPIPQDYPGEVGRLKWWIDQRINWFDSYIPGLCSDVSASENNFKENIIKLYPNPAGNNFHLSYIVPAENKTFQVSIELFNKLGEEVLLKFGDKSSGVHEEEISISDLPPGVYTMKLNINTISYSKKIVKL